MSQQVRLFGVQVDALRMREAVEQLLAWTSEPLVQCRYVVTPNVDHVVMLAHHAGLQAAYEDADLILVDGTPVVWAARLVGRPVPEKVPGSDLTPGLFAAVPPDQTLRVFLLGAGPGVADKAAFTIQQRWPAVQVVGTYSPPMGFEKESAENAAILQRIDVAQPDVLVVGLGAPKQELWVHAHRHRLAAKVALCVGATIDFLAGEKPRAPRWMRQAGLEWLHRVWMEPKRLAARYVRDAWIFPQLVAREYFRGQQAAEESKTPRPSLAEPKRPAKQ